MCVFMGAVPLRQSSFVCWMEHISALGPCLLVKSVEPHLNKEMEASLVWLFCSQLSTMVPCCQGYLDPLGSDGTLQGTREAHPAPAPPATREHLAH